MYTRLIYSKMEAVAPLGIDARRKEEGWGASHGSKTGNLGKMGASKSRREEKRFLSLWKGDLVHVWWKSGAQSPFKTLEVQERSWI